MLTGMIGSLGNLGTAVGNLIAANGNEVIGWEHNPQVVTQSRKVLITGADGFIGSHLVEELLSRGRDVRAFVYYDSFNSWGWLDTLPKNVLSGLDVFAGDVRDPNGVQEAAKGWEQIFHLAALIAIPFS